MPHERKDLKEVRKGDTWRDVREEHSKQREQSVQRPCGRSACFSRDSQEGCVCV